MKKNLRELNKQEAIDLGLQEIERQLLEELDEIGSKPIEYYFQKDEPKAFGLKSSIEIGTRGLCNNKKDFFDEVVNDKDCENIITIKEVRESKIVVSRDSLNFDKIPALLFFINNFDTKFENNIYPIKKSSDDANYSFFEIDDNLKIMYAEANTTHRTKGLSLTHAFLDDDSKFVVSSIKRFKFNEKGKKYYQLIKDVDELIYQIEAAVPNRYASKKIYHENNMIVTAIDGGDSGSYINLDFDIFQELLDKNQDFIQLILVYKERVNFRFIAKDKTFEIYTTDSGTFLFKKELLYKFLGNASALDIILHFKKFLEFKKMMRKLNRS